MLSTLDLSGGASCHFCWIDPQPDIHNLATKTTAHPGSSSSLVLSSAYPPRSYGLLKAQL
jgi:hypothetical protein